MFNCPMQSSSTNRSGANPFERDRTPPSIDFDLPGNPTLWLSLATIPLLLFLLSAKALFDLMQQLGLASEELFRGDRLPIINLFDPFGSETNNPDQ